MLPSTSTGLDSRQFILATFASYHQIKKTKRKMVCLILISCLILLNNSHWNCITAMAVDFSRLHYSSYLLMFNITANCKL